MNRRRAARLIGIVFQADHVAETSGGFVILGGHSFVELFSERFGNGVFLTNLAFEQPELFDKLFVWRIILLDASHPRFLIFREPAPAFEDGVYGGLGVLGGECAGHRSLGAVEQDETAITFVREFVFLAWPVNVDEVHHIERVIGVLEGFLITLKGQPRDASMVELNEFAVGFEAMFPGHGEKGRFSRALWLLSGAMLQVLEIGGKSVRSASVGATVDLHLHQSKLDANLKHRAVVFAANLARLELARFRVVRPVLQSIVDIPPHAALPRVYWIRSDQRQTPNRLLSHHHGVGRSKAPKLGAELGLGVSAVHALRGVFDPAGIMNPGNLLPRENGVPAVRPAPALPSSPVVDRVSGMVHARGEATIEELERALAAAGLGLGLGPDAPGRATTIAAWLAEGARGAPDAWLDPVDHLVAGFTARLASGADLEVRPAPRRAVGPDLYALFHGARGRAGVITSAHLPGRGPSGARPLATTIERDPPVGDDEGAWIARALDAAGAVR